jgi:hypothetical protein
MSQELFSRQKTSWSATNSGGIMKFRWTLLLAIVAVPHVAYADWEPITVADNYLVTVGATVNGSHGEITYSEDANSGNYLPSVARDVYSITDSLMTELDSQVREMSIREGFSFQRGELTGEPTVTMQPNGAGYLITRLTGLNYKGVASGTYRYGILSASCTVTVRLTNIVLTAQIGSATGAMPEDSVGMTATPTSHVNCSTNIDWIPIVNLVVSIWEEHGAQGWVNRAAKDAMAKMKDKLFFERDANAYAGLNRIVPADKVIPLPNGQSFAVGQWLHGQLAWILNNVNANITLGQGAKVETFTGWTMPDYWVIGNVARFNLVVGGVTLDINMREEVLVEWAWGCNSWPCPEVP